MLLLAGSTQKLQLVTSAAGTLDVSVSFMDMTNADPPVVQGSTSSSQETAITTATTTDICAAPSGSVRRNVKTIHVRNKSATTATDVTIVKDISATDYELCKFNLGTGEALEYIEGVGFYKIPVAPKLDTVLRVTADSVHATAATFAGITGLSAPVEAGKFYMVEACLIHIGNATTTGAQFAFGGVAMTSMIAGVIDVTLVHATAPTFSSNVVTAVDTAISVETTGAATNAPGIIGGMINPSATGTFQLKASSEVTVGAGLTVKAGSWMHIREFDN